MAALGEAGRSEPRRAWGHSALAPVSARPPLLEYLQQVWDRRHFVATQAYSQAIGQNQGTLAGNAWLVLAPLLDGAVYWLIFAVVFKANNGIPDFAQRLIIGILLFAWVNRSISGATSSVFAGKALMRAFSFPRACLPLAAVIKELVTLIPMLATMLFLIFLIPPHATPRWTWLILPLPMALMAGFNTGAGLLLARVANSVPDITKILGYLMRFWLYLSGIVFDVSKFGQHPTISFLTRNNPLFLLVDVCRQLLLYGTVPAPHQWLTLLGWGIGMLIVGLIFFWRAEANYGRQRIA